MLPMLLRAELNIAEQPLGGNMPEKEIKGIFKELVLRILLLRTFNIIVISSCLFILYLELHFKLKVKWI